MRMICNVTYKTVEEAIRAMKMFALQQYSTVSVIQGKFRAARASQREFAKLATEDFDTFKTMPIIKVQHVVGFKEWLGLAWKFLTFKIFKAFTKKTPEEKQLKKLAQQYFKEIPPEELKKRTINVDLKPPLYF